jgi:hypothetical protein
MNWFWDHAMSNFSGSELLTFQAMIFRDVVRNPDNDYQILVPKMAKSNLLLDEILVGNIDAFPHLWNSHDRTESQIVGSKYIALLRSLSVDFKRSIEAELERLPGRILQDSGERNLGQKIMFYEEDGQAWVLRWEWILDEEVPGYNLLSEFPSMTCDGCDDCKFGWLFFPINGDLSDNHRQQEGPKWYARHARRLAKTARKELARTGQKRPRSRMPGAWI